MAASGHSSEIVDILRGAVGDICDSLQAWTNEVEAALNEVDDGDEYVEIDAAIFERQAAALEQLVTEVRLLRAQIKEGK